MKLRVVCIIAVLAATFCPATSHAKKGTVTIAAVGDIMFGRYVPRRKGARYIPVVRTGDPFEHVAASIKPADIAFANLETPVMVEPKHVRVSNTLVFRADPEVATTLNKAGFDIVSLANNHTHNLGCHGATESRMHCEKRGLRVVGAGKDLAAAFAPEVIEINDVKVAFLAFTVWRNARKTFDKTGAVAFVDNRGFLKKALPLVEAAKKKADFVLVSIHWGIEYEPHPRKHQRRIAHRLVDAGADVILGHHPHVLQDFEQYKGKLIAYSLGNFMFDNPIVTRRQTVILHLTLQKLATENKVTDLKLEPILIGRRDHKPRPATGGSYRVIRNKLRRLARRIPLTDKPVAKEQVDKKKNAKAKKATTKKSAPKNVSP